MCTLFTPCFLLIEKKISKIIINNYSIANQKNHIKNNNDQTFNYQQPFQEIGQFLTKTKKKIIGQMKNKWAGQCTEKIENTWFWPLILIQWRIGYLSRKFDLSFNFLFESFKHNTVFILLYLMYNSTNQPGKLFAVRKPTWVISMVLVYVINSHWAN